MQFKDTLERHLRAILARDLEDYAATLCREAPLTLVLPGGRLVEGFEAVANLHEAWFREPWTFSYEIEDTFEASGYAWARLRTRITELDEDGHEISLRSLLVLHFILEGGEWRLTFDQNTVIA